MEGLVWHGGKKSKCIQEEVNNCQRNNEEDTDEESVMDRQTLGFHLFLVSPAFFQGEEGKECFKFEKNLLVMINSLQLILVILFLLGFKNQIFNTVRETYGFQELKG